VPPVKNLVYVPDAIVTGHTRASVVLDDVSVAIRFNTGTLVAAAGFDLAIDVITTESVVADAWNDTVNVAPVVLSDLPVVSAPTVVELVAEVVTEALSICAFEGIAETNPIPNDATETSATRLNSVFVDIYFLSIVVIETFPMAALR